MPRGRPQSTRCGLILGPYLIICGKRVGKWGAARRRQESRLGTSQLQCCGLLPFGLSLTSGRSFSMHPKSRRDF